MNDITSVIYLILMGLFLYKLYKSNRGQVQAENDEDGLEFNQVSEDIEKLKNIRDSLYDMEQLISCIEMCEPEEHEMGVRIEWSDPSGTNYSYNFILDGCDDISELFQQIACQERKILRTSLSSQIKKMSDRCNENCNENYDFSVGDRFAKNERGEVS